MGTFLEAAVYKRELALNFCKYNKDYDNLKGLPAWSAATLRQHGRDQRPNIYTRAQLEEAKTHDDLWNAGHEELRKLGKMHPQIRKFWGKKIVEWSKTPQEALETMIYLNNKYALDGRDPCSYSGFMWCFGKHDRPMGPERRQIFGLIRSAPSEMGSRKPQMKSYIQRIKKLK